MEVTQKYINPFTDFGFKKLFGSEPNKDLLMDFLNELLPEKHKIHTLTYSKSEFPGLDINERKAVFDIYCANEHGDKFIVEIQRAKQVYFKDRSIFYSTFPIQEQAIKGEWNFKLAAVYTIAILDFVFDPTVHFQSVLTTVQLKNQNNQVFYDKLTYIYLQMPYFIKTADELETNFEKWLFILKNIERLTEIPDRLQNKIFMKFFGEAEIANMAKEDRAAYEHSLKVYRDLKNVTDTAFEDGMRKSESQLIPRLEEIERLRKQEEKLRKQEHKLRIEEQKRRQEEQKMRQEESKRTSLSVQKLHSLGITIQEIAEYLNISLDEVEQYLK